MLGGRGAEELLQGKKMLEEDSRRDRLDAEPLSGQQSSFTGSQPHW